MEWMSQTSWDRLTEAMLAIIPKIGVVTKLVEQHSSNRFCEKHDNMLIDEQFVISAKKVVTKKQIEHRVLKTRETNEANKTTQ